MQKKAKIGLSGDGTPGIGHVRVAFATDEGNSCVAEQIEKPWTRTGQRGTEKQGAKPRSLVPLLFSLVIHNS